MIELDINHKNYKKYKLKVDTYYFLFLYSVISKGVKMKFKHINLKDKVAVFNGFQAKVVDFDDVDKFKISIPW